MWDVDDGNQGNLCSEITIKEDICCGSLPEDFHQSGSCHPPTLSGLLPPDDHLPVDIKQEECTEDSMVTDLLLDSDTAEKVPSPDLIKEDVFIHVNFLVVI